MILPGFADLIPIMKIVENTADRLHLASTPWFVGLLGVGMVLLGVNFGFRVLGGSETQDNAILGVLACIGMGAGLLIFFARRDDVVLDRVEGRVTMKHRTILGKPAQVQYPLAEVARALVQSNNDGESNTHRPALELTTGRREPITPVYSSGKGARTACDTINVWLAALDSAPRGE